LILEIVNGYGKFILSEKAGVIDQELLLIRIQEALLDKSREGC